MLGGLYALWKILGYLWDEWSGAPARWLRGEPLRASEVLARIYRAEEARRQAALDQERILYRSRYANNNSLILDAAFRRRFKDLGLHDEVRYEVFRRHDYTCNLCAKKPKRKGGLHLDHIRPIKHYPELEFASYNLQALCASCNRHKQAYDGDDWRDVTKARKRATAKRRKAARDQAAE